MHIKTIQVKNYRCYTDFTAQFEPGMNVVAGVNGSGKTSLLMALRETFAGLLSFFQINSGTLQPLQDTDVRLERLAVKGRYRFEPCYPVSITATAELLDALCQWTTKRTSQANAAQWDGETPGQRWHRLAGPESVYATEGAVLPLLAFYPAYRRWPSVQLNQMQAVTQKESRTDGYRSWWDASAEVTSFQQWTIAKNMERLQRATEQEIPPEVANDDELGIVNGALGQVVGGASGLRYDFAQKAIVVDWDSPERPSTLFENLSDGQRVAIALVADIARRMCLLNPQLGMNVTRDTTGVVLIDELDVHLHPKWQRMMVLGLTQAFPNIQFIVSSHSPQILSEIKPEQIILLTAEGAVHPVASYGLDSSRVLEQIMGADPRPAEVKDLLADLLLTIERNDLTHASFLLEQLRGKAPELPELVRAEALIKRKEVLGR